MLYLLNSNPLYLFRCRFWERHRQDTILHFGLHAVRLGVE